MRFVILAVKSQATLDAVASLDVAAPPGVAVACAQNGVENERVVLRRFPATYAVNVMLPSLHLEPGVVVPYGSPVNGILDVGRYPSGVDETAQLDVAEPHQGRRQRRDRLPDRRGRAAGPAPRRRHAGERPAPAPRHRAGGRRAAAGLGAGERGPGPAGLSPPASAVAGIGLGLVATIASM